MATPTELEDAAARAKRRRQRTLFGGVADQYDRSRPGYSHHVVDSLLATVGLGSGGRVLEVGCGTGQLTRVLAEHPIEVVAIDIDAAMVDVARTRLGSTVDLRVVGFEELDCDDESFDLIVSADAFHWVDPEVRWSKAARLLCRRGWVGVLGHASTYADPIGSRLLALWIELSSDGGAWAQQPPRSPEEQAAALANWGGLADSGLFAPAIVRTHAAQSRVSPHVVFEREHTRATTLSYEADKRAAFTAGLSALLEGVNEIVSNDDVHVVTAQRA